jgi:GNAT superfamily N-acetyltransferase
MTATPSDAVYEITAGKSQICTEIMASLPDWFSVPDNITACVEAIRDWPTLGISRGSETLGFIALKVHNPHSVEIYALALRQDWHRHGLGRQLVEGAEAFCRDYGARLLTAKTLAPTTPDKPNYAATRRFYQALDFIPAEILTTVWDEAHPCLFLVKPL